MYKRVFSVILLAGCSVIVVSSLAACQQPGSHSSSSLTKDARSSAQLSTMIIRGQISRVMESYPLQLAVEAEEKEYQVALGPATVIIRGSKEISPGQLSPGQRVEIAGTEVGRNSIDAERIEVLD